MKYIPYKIFILIIILCNQVYAATIPASISDRLTEIPSAINQGNIQKRYDQTLPSQVAPLSPIKRPAEQPSAFGAQAEKIKFKLTKVNITGNTVYSTQSLENIFTPYYHQTISLAKLQSLVDDITTKYRNDGYVLSRAYLPPQTIKGGVVKVQIVEGFINEITIEGSNAKTQKMLQKYAAPVTQSRPFQIKTLERSLLLMNDLPGVSAQSVITPSKTASGGADLTIVSSVKKFTAYSSYDNYGTRYLGPQEFGLGFGLNALAEGSGDTASLLTVPHTTELQSYQWIHTNPVGSNGGKFTFTGNYTNTKAGFVLDDFEVIGRSQLLDADMSYPIIRSRTKNLYVHAMANYNNVSSTILGSEFYDDLMRTLVIGGDINGIDSWRGINDASLDIEKGFDIMGATQHFLQSRPKGVPNFTKFNVNLSRLQMLPIQLSFLASFQGQYSCNPLYATEQYAFGGPIYGRGYPPSEIIGDDGIGTKLELRRDQGFGMRWLSAAQFYLFYDAGIIWNRDGVNLPAKQSATSTGLGTRLTFIPQLTANLYYAKPLTHSIAQQLAMNKDPLKPGIFFQLIASV